MADARKICQAAGGRGVVVLVFGDDGRVVGSSYGETVRDCDDMRRVLDNIVVSEVGDERAETWSATKP